MYVNARDCYFNKGRCIYERCECEGLQTGLHCQINCTTEEMTNLNELRRNKRIEKDIEEAQAQEIIAAKLEESELKTNGVKENERERVVGGSSNRKRTKGKMKGKMKPGAVRKKKNDSDSDSSITNTNADKNGEKINIDRQRIRKIEKLEADKDRESIDNHQNDARVERVIIDDKKDIDDRQQNMREVETAKQILLNAHIDT